MDPWRTTATDLSLKEVQLSPLLQGHFHNIPLPRPSEDGFLKRFKHYTFVLCLLLARVRMLSCLKHCNSAFVFWILFLTLPRAARSWKKNTFIK